MILNDMQIDYLARNKNMITPYIGESVKRIDNDDTEFHPIMVGWNPYKKVISYGLSSFGYDLRVKDGFQLFYRGVHDGVIDPKAFDKRNVGLIHAKDGDDFIIVPPNSFALAESIETFKIPQDVLGVVYGKSTYARCGIITNVTPLEPGWEGTVTLEISNTTSLPAKIYINEGLCQVLFMQGERPRTTYSDRNGKYQNQSGITLPTV